MLEHVSLFRDLSARQIAALEKCASRAAIPKNTVVFNKGDKSDCLYILLQGSAKAVRQDATGRQVILNRFRPNEYFGEMSFWDGNPRCATVMTREACEVLTIPRDAFLKLSAENAGVYETITKFLLSKLRSATQQIEDLAIASVYSRLARIFSEHQGPGGMLSESFTQQELAEMVGSTRETICRLINELTANGYLAKGKNRFVIKKKLPYKYK